MIATLRQVTVEPYQEYNIVVEVADGDRSQIYRCTWELGYSRSILGIDDKGDQRRAMGEALEELGRSLQAGHGHDLVDLRDLRGT